MGFFMCKLEPDIWIWHNEDIYEYIVYYINSLEIVESYNKNLMDSIENKYKFKLKGER